MLTYKDRTAHYKKPLVFDLLGVLLAVNLHPHIRNLPLRPQIIPADFILKIPDVTSTHLHPAHPHFTITLFWACQFTSSVY